MSTAITNKVAFLRTTRNFPEELKQLTVEITKTYLDIATAVNDRIIGTFPATQQAVTGETWFLSGANQKQQSVRQVYAFTSTAAINHGISNVQAGQFIRCFGSYTDGTNTYGLIWGTSVAIAGQISFYTTATQIVFALGAGAPTLASGTIVLEWLSQT